MSIIDYIFFNFTDYLIKIGFLTNSNIQDFQKNYITQSSNFDNSTLAFNSEKFSDSIFFQDKISTCVVDYLNSLNNDKKKLLGISLFTKFCEEQLDKKLNFAKLLFNKYNIKKIFPYFNKWKKNSKTSDYLFKNYKSNLNNLTSFQPKKYIKNNKNNLDIKINKKIPNKQNQLFQYKKSFNENLNPKRENSKEKTLINSYDLKEMEELKECTFKPKINDYNSYKNSKKKNSEIIEKLYSDNKKRKEKSQELHEKNKKYENENTFKPNLISKSPKNINNDFHERLKKFYNQKMLSIKNLREKIEDDYSKKYTFSPDISQSQNTLSKSFSLEQLNCNLPIYQRLYLMSEEQKRKKSLKEKENNLEIKNLANSLYNKRNDNEKINSSVDYKKIEELYNDYKKKQNKLLKKRADLDAEQGLTFQPEIYSNRKYYNKIDNNFDKREQDYLNKKSQNLQKLINDGNDSCSSRRYSKKEKEEITNNIINRLYKKGVEKYRCRKLSADNSHREVNENNYSDFGQKSFGQNFYKSSNNYINNIDNQYMVEDNNIEKRDVYIHSPSPIKYTKKIKIKISK